MKFICTNDFPNPVGKPFKIGTIECNGKTVEQAHITVAGKPAVEHIHKGAIFEYGTAAKFEDLSPAEKTLVAFLVMAKKITEATPAAVEKVQADVKADKERAARDEKSAKDLRGPSMAEIMQALPQLIAVAVANAKK